MTDIIVYDSGKTPLLTSLPSNQKRVNLSELRKAGQMFGGWFSKQHLWAFFHGSFSRDNGAIERGIKKLVDRGEWVAHPFEKRLVYSVKRVHRLRGHSYPSKIYHELNVTGGFVRLWNGDNLPKELSPSSFFNGKPLRPEWALKLSSETTILYEFCTDDNFKTRLKSKVEKYSKVLEGIEKPLVLFVCDVDMKFIKGFVERHRNLLTIYHNGQSLSPYYFTDARIFREVPLGQALTAPIYLWQDSSIGGLR